MLALSLEDVKAEAKMRRLRHEARRLGLLRGWRPTYVQALLTVGAVLLAILVGLRFYWDQPVERRQILLDQADPMSVLGNVQTALEHYAITHGRRYPDTLYDLLPLYLTDTKQNRKVLRHLDYALSEREGYVLKVGENAPFPGKELMVTARGMRPSELNLPGEAK